MNLVEAIYALQDNEEFMETVQKLKLTEAYLLLDKAACTLVAEHGSNYVTLEKTSANRFGFEK